MNRSFQTFVRRLNKIELRETLEKRAARLHVSLRDLYEGPREASISAARRDVYLWLSGRGKGINEIARMFDRAPSGVLKLMRRRVRKKRKAKK
jgi:hypothetical protein